MECRILHHQQLNKRCSDAAYEVVNEEASCTHLPLQASTKHPQGEHIEEEVRKVGVQEHICQRLPETEEGAARREEGKVLQNGGPIQYEHSQECHSIGYKQILHCGGKRALYSV